MSSDTEACLPHHSHFLRSYWSETPFPLAFERTWECGILSRQKFVRPVLDVGCGEGLFAKMLFREPLDTGIDPNDQELTRARKLGMYNELIQCTGDRIPKPDGAYRTIFSNSVLEHIPDVEPVLSEMSRLLAPGGRLYVTVPSHQYDHYTVVCQMLTVLGLKGLAARYRRFFNRFWHHFHYYRPEAWQALFQKHGFQVLECHTYGPRPLCMLNDFLVPFSLPSMVLKKLFNCWTLWPRLRRLALAPLASWGEVVARRGAQAQDGGLVFLALGKGVNSQTIPSAA